MTPGRSARVRIGAQIAPQHTDYATIRSAVARLEDVGVDAIFNWDHFFPLTGDPDGAHFEAWTMLGAIAEQTSRVEFGPLVSCMAFRNPDLQADMARTLDHISAGPDGVGRFVFGTGSGWFDRDFDEYGFEFGTAGSRLDLLADGLPRVRARWEALVPAPTRRIPVLIGGGGEQKTLRLVAEHADIWHSFADPDTLLHKIGVLRHWCERVGRDPDEIELATGTSVRGLGSLEPCVVDAHLDLGVRLFVLAVEADDPVPLRLRELLAWRDSVDG